MTDSGASAPPARPFGLWTATALVVGNMIGAGIFVLPQSLAPYGWTGLVAWAIVIPATLLLALLFSKLTAARPHATGALAIVSEGIGPLPGVLVGWSFWVGWWTACAIIAVTAIRYLSTFAPALAATPMATALAASLLILVIVAINLRGAKSAGRFQVVTTLLKLLPLIAVAAIVAGLAMAGGERFAAEPETPFAPLALTAAVTLAFYAMTGFESTALCAERVRDPARNVRRATMLGVAATGILYLVVCSGVIFALPAAQVAAAPAPIALFVETYWGRAAGLAVAGFAVVAAVGCLNGGIFLLGEMPLGMARAGLLPVWMARTDARGVPTTMIMIGAGCAIVLILSTATGPSAGVLNFMLNLSSAVALWLYIGVCVAAWRLGVARGSAMLVLAFCIWAMIGTGIAGLWGVALMLTALPLYWMRSAAPSPQPAE